MSSALHHPPAASRRLRRRLLGTSLLLLPLLRIPLPHGLLAATLFLGTFAVVVVHGAAAIPTLAGAGHRLPVVLASGVAVASGAAYGFHPSSQGVVVLLPAVLGALTASSVATLSIGELRRYVAAPLLVAAAVQGAIVATQWLTAAPVVLGLLTPGAALGEIDGFLRPQGTTSHVYEPAVLALVAVGIVAAVGSAGGPRWAIGTGLVLASWAVAFSHSRSALVGVATLAIVGIWAHRAGRRAVTGAVGVFLVGFLVGSLLSAGGWLVRVDHTATTDLDRASLGRVTLLRQSLEITATSPLVGVGPANYRAVLETLPDYDPDLPYLVHDVPLAWAAELGVPAAVALAALLVVVVGRAVGGGPGTAAIVAASSGFFVFDKILYDRLFGTLLFGVSLGVLAVLADRFAAEVPEGTGPTLDPTR
ncbi:MAG TPA: O-antigen ligase domain-containing protein [Actinobacteria bacterium]|nr:O-antigen ligase domain-containing protein [Actinomycetota bacterium]